MIIEKSSDEMYRIAANWISPDEERILHILCGRGEFAQLLRVSESTVRNYIRKGYIKAIKFGTERRATVRIPKSEIESLYDINSPKEEE